MGPKLLVLSLFIQPSWTHCLVSPKSLEAFIVKFQCPVPPCHSIPCGPVQYPLANCLACRLSLLSDFSLCTQVNFPELSSQLPSDSTARQKGGQISQPTNWLSAPSIRPPGIPPLPSRSPVHQPTHLLALSSTIVPASYLEEKKSLDALRSACLDCLLAVQLQPSEPTSPCLSSFSTG